MIAQAGVHPGMKVLEIGSGGYNAALLAEVTGKEGRVVTIDIDPEITGRAEAVLAAVGYGDWVEVVTGDGEFGVPAGAPYDVIIVTAGAWDIPPALDRAARPERDPGGSAAAEHTQPVARFPPRGRSPGERVMGDVRIRPHTGHHETVALTTTRFRDRLMTGAPRVVTDARASSPAVICPR